MISGSVESAGPDPVISGAAIHDLFEQRLRADQRVLAEVFAPGTVLGDPVRVAPRLGGRRGGQALEVCFGNGLTLIYKPWPLGFEAAYAGLVEALGEAPGILPFPAGRLRATPTLCRGSHGWAAAPAHRLADSREELERFYRSAGSLAALAYLLGIDGLTDDNVIAVGDALLPMDLDPPGPVPAGAGRRGVLASALLPGHALDGADCSGLWGGPPVAPDESTPRHCATRLPPEQVFEFAAPLVLQGFTATYGGLVQRRAVLAAPRGPLEAFAAPMRDTDPGKPSGTAFDAMMATLAALGDEDLALQSAALQQALIARVAVLPAPALMARTPSDPGLALPGRPELLAAAEDIAYLLVETGHPLPDGRLSWIGLVPHADRDTYRVAVDDKGLRHGSLGVALFFAALSQVSGYGMWRELALDLSHRTLAWIDPALPVEAASGAGAEPHVLAQFEDLVRAARLMARLLDQPHLLAIAGRAAARLGDTARWQSPLGVPAGPAGQWRDIDADSGRLAEWVAAVAHPALEPVDGFLCGTAGKIDALASAARRYRRADLLQSARVHAALALARARTNRWQLVEGHPSAQVPGLMHGLAGIGYTLLRLAEPETLPGLGDPMGAALASVS